MGVESNNCDLIINYFVFNVTTTLTFRTSQARLLDIPSNHKPIQDNTLETTFKLKFNLA